ncbi:sensor histidine kinase [Desertihabitans aurantiacus]|uniref:sensor histidine kinase n=1 Tax=Desertihabitans aurantiacus TaxID=2282477 RepID=UPI0018E5491A|nr:ATP-binding protein [Desertihabitans aurantiacus]
MVVLYMLVALGAFVLCGVGLALAQRHAALQEAVRDAEVTTTLLASRVVQPTLPRTPLDPADVDETLDQVIRERVLVAPIDQVRIVDEQGIVVYATDSSSLGQRQPLTAGELDALHDGTAVATADGDEGSDPTRLLGDREGQSLVVGVGVRSPSDQALLLQTRQPYEAVWFTGRTVWLTLLPSFVLALTLLYLAKIGFAYRLTRSLYGVQEEREQLLVTALAAADRERTLIASDLHDGVVQGLTGASYTLTDAANRTRSAGQPELADTITETARNLRRWVRELRSLIVTVTPPALHSEGLRATLTDLTATLEARGIDVELDVEVGDTLSETGESLVYRAAQEAIRNVIRHSGASRVRLLVAEQDGWLQLQLTDDGRGFDPSAESARRRGSVGLTLLAALVHQRGGRLTVESAVGDGTTVTLLLPEQAAPDAGDERSTAGVLR